MSIDKTVPKVQRALVLQGGGALRAYEAGKLQMEDKENGGKGLLF
jgi:hypothetical protein